MSPLTILLAHLAALAVTLLGIGGLTWLIASIGRLLL
jgi:hypothetical protein